MKNFGSVCEYSDFNAHRIQREKEQKMLKEMKKAAIRFVGGTALAIYWWNETDYGMRATVCTVAGVTIACFGAYDFCYFNREYYLLLPSCQQKRLMPTWGMYIGTFAYMSSVYAFSASLKRNSILWMPCLGLSLVYHWFATASATNFRMSFSERTPLLKLCDLMAGPALYAGAAYYLMCIQEHGKGVVFCLPLMKNLLVGNYASPADSEKAKYRNEPRWFLFKAMEKMTGQCIGILSSVALGIYMHNRAYHPAWIALCCGHAILSAVALVPSLQLLQEYMGVPEHVSFNTSLIIDGPIVFSPACVIFKFLDSFYKLPLFFLIAGTCVAMTGKGVYDLYNQCSRPDFKRYCQQSLGPSCVLYGTLASVYFGYQMRWRFSLVAAFSVPIGMYLTYRGFS